MTMPINQPPKALADLPAIVPLFPLAGCILLPQAQLPLNVFEPRYVAMIDDALRSGQRAIGIIQPQAPQVGQGTNPFLLPTGCTGRISHFGETGDGRYIVTLTGLCRFTLAEEFETLTPYRQGRVDYSAFADDLKEQETGGVDAPMLLSVLQQYLNARNMEYDWQALQRAPVGALVTSLAMMAPWGIAEKQALLEAPTLKDRADLLIALGQKDLMMDSSGHAPPLQ